MSVIPDWQNDPMVKIERAILPVLWLPFDYLIGGEDQCSYAEVANALGRAIDVFEKYAADELDPIGVTLDAKSQSLCELAAKETKTVQRNLQSSVMVDGKTDDRVQWLHHLTVKLRPAVENALDAIREAFLTKVLQDQAKNEKLTKKSISQLESISKQIFFVAVNASIEAKRIGEKGAGIAYIGSEIRELSQSATRAISQMRAEL